MVRLFAPFVLTLALALLNTMADRGHVCRCALDRPLLHLVIKVRNQLQLMRHAVTSTAIVAHAWVVQVRTVRRVEPRRVSRLTLLVAYSSIPSSVLLVDLQCRQSTRNVVDAAWSRPDIGIDVTSQLSPPVVACTGGTPRRRPADRACRVLPLGLLRGCAEVVAFLGSDTLVIVIVFVRAGGTRALST